MARPSGTTVHSGVVGLMAPAVEEFTRCSAAANSRSGTALANSETTVICVHTCAERGTGSRRARTMANRTVRARVSHVRGQVGSCTASRASPRSRTAKSTTFCWPNHWGRSWLSTSGATPGASHPAVERARWRPDHIQASRDRPDRQPWKGSGFDQAPWRRVQQKAGITPPLAMGRSARPHATRACMRCITRRLPRR
jgi:hypothetical protein